MSVDTCAARMVSAARRSSRRSAPFLTSTASTPAQPIGVSIGATMAPVLTSLAADDAHPAAAKRFGARVVGVGGHARQLRDHLVGVAVRIHRCEHTPWASGTHKIRPVEIEDQRGFFKHCREFLGFLRAPQSRAEMRDRGHVDAFWLGQRCRAASGTPAHAGAECTDSE